VSILSKCAMIVCIRFLWVSLETRATSGKEYCLETRTVVKNPSFPPALTVQYPARSVHLEPLDDGMCRNPVLCGGVLTAPCLYH